MRPLLSIPLAAATLVAFAPPARADEAPPPASSPASSPPLTRTIAAGAGYTCALGAHDSVADEDAATATDVVCHALVARRAKPAAYQVRFEKLGTRLLLVVASPQLADERRLFLESLDEVPVAAARIARAFALGTTIDDAIGPDNVVGPETAPSRSRMVQAGVDLGVVGSAGAGKGSSPAGGVSLAVHFRLQNLVLLTEGRASGIGSADDKLGSAYLGAGVRYVFGDGDVSPFVGGGLGFAYFQANQGELDDFDGSGLDTYAEVGLSFWRSSRVGASVSFRADMPCFLLKQDTDDDLTDTGRGTAYVVPLSLNLALRFN